MRILRSYVLTSLLLLLFVIQASAQLAKMELGLEAGAGMTDLTYEDADQQMYEPALGYSLGITYQYNLSPVISIRSGLSYSKKGAILPLTFTNNLGVVLEELSLSQNMSYLILPVMAKVMLGHERKFFVNVGPYVGYLINHKLDYEEYEQLRVLAEDQNQAYERMDIGLTGGVGGVIPVNENIDFTVEFRGDLGMYNIISNPSTQAGNLRTRTANVVVGMIVKLNGR